MPHPFGVAAALLCLVFCMTARATEIVAHRGASADAPENTVGSEKLGYAQGADGGELDIHLSKDGHVVVIHDYDTKRTGGVDRKVVDQTLAELKAINVGDFGPWKGKGFVEPLPTLDEILAIVPPGRKIFIEIKVHEEILPALEEALRRSKLPAAQTPIITFYLEVAEAAKRRLPGHKVYWLAGYSKDEPNPTIDELISRAKAAKLDGLDLQHDFPLDAAAIRKIHDAGLAIYVWTLDDPVKARQLAEDGVDGITTNRPGELRREMESARAARENPKPETRTRDEARNPTPEIRINDQCP